MALALAGTLAAGLAQAEASCKPVLEAMTRYLNVPSHKYSTTILHASSSPPEVMESINTGSKRYLRAGGRWIENPMSDAEILQMTKENARSLQCRVLREEPVNGEPSIVYEVIQAASAAESSGEYFVSQRTGLPLKEEMIVGPAAAPLAHISGRIDYQHVQAPPLG